MQRYAGAATYSWASNSRTKVPGAVMTSGMTSSWLGALSRLACCEPQRPAPSKITSFGMFPLNWLSPRMTRMLIPTWMAPPVSPEAVGMFTA